jgi:hypothetical protein
MFKRLPLLSVSMVLILLVASIALAQGSNDRDATSEVPQVRLVHAAPFAANDADTAVTVTVNGEEVISDFQYTDFTDYVTLDGAGDIDVAVLVGGSPVIEETLTVADDTQYTVVAVGEGTNQPLGLTVLADDNTPPAAGNAHLRIVHAAPFGVDAATTAVDICTQDGSLVGGLANVPFLAESGYLPLPAGSYDLRVAAHDPGTPCAGATIIDPLPVTLEDGSIITVFAIGDANNQPPGLLALPVGLLATANVRVIHLAPFAMDPADTAVTVEVDGMPVVEDFQFTDFTDYLSLPYAGDYEVTVLTGGAEVLSGTLTIEAGKEYAASAIGGSNGWPLEFFVLEDDNSAPDPGNAHLRIAHTAPFAADLTDTTVDICTQDGSLVGGLAGVPYKVASDYLPLPAGTYDLKVTLANPTACAGLPIIDPAPVTLPDGAVVTVYAYGDALNQIPGLLAVPVGVLEVLPPLVRVVHVAPFAPAVKDTVVSLSVDEQILPGELAYLESTDYIPLPAAGPYLFEVLVDSTVAISDTVTLGAGVPHTIAAIGDGTNQPLAFLVLTDDMTPPEAGNGKLRIAHTAPFATDIDDTRVDICTEDNNLVAGLAGVPYGAETGFLTLPATIYDLKVLAAADTPCTGDLIFDLPSFELPDGAIVTVFAVGGANNQPPGAFSPEVGRLGIPYLIYLPAIRGS